MVPIGEAVKNSRTEPNSRIAENSWFGATPVQYEAWADVAAWLELPLFVGEAGLLRLFQVQVLGRKSLNAEGRK